MGSQVFAWSLNHPGLPASVLGDYSNSWIHLLAMARILNGTPLPRSFQSVFISESMALDS